MAGRDELDGDGAGHIDVGPQPPPGILGTAAAAVKPKLDECQHYAPNVAAVLDQVTGERLAWYCQACDQQLPATWALSKGKAP